MTDAWTPGWDLTTVPDALWWAETGRRRGAQSYVVKKLTKPCLGCGINMGARERRKGCPHCGVSQVTGKLVKKRGG
jgi:hypothetical protein